MPTYLTAPGYQAGRAALTHLPRPDRCAAEAVQRWAEGRGIDLDPDQVDVVTLHYQYDNDGCYVQVVDAVSLTQALLGNWQGEHTGNPLGSWVGEPWAGHPPPASAQWVTTLPYQHDPFSLVNSNGYLVYNGLYRRTAPGRYSAAGHVNLRAEAFQAFIWALDFSKPYAAQLDAYWATHTAAYAQAANSAFIAACNRQAGAGSLSAAGQRLAWQAAGLESWPTWASLGLPRKGYPPLVVAPLNVYGYTATHLLYIVDTRTKRTLLYIPGNAAPLHEFERYTQAQDWFAAQCRDPAKRAALKAHFRQQDAPDGLDFSGLDTALAGLAAYPEPHYFAPSHEGFATSGYWPPRTYVNYQPKRYSPLLGPRVFAGVAARQYQRCRDDAAYIITQDSTVTKARWRGYLASTVNTLAPLAVAIPALAPLFAAAGLAQFGLGLDAAINGKTLADKTAGVEDATFGALNALPLAQLPEAEAAEVFGGKRNGFVRPQQVNGQWGYPLSPLDPPHWAEAPVQAHFHLDAAIEPLAGADAAVAGGVIRTPGTGADPDVLEASLGGYGVTVMYDIDHDAFITVGSENEIDPPLYLAPAEASHDLQPAPPGREGTDAGRMRTLRALGIDLHLPLDLRSPLAAPAAPLPRLFTSLWVGDQAIGEGLLETLGNNAANLQAAGYDYRLLLSRSDPAAYARNLAALQAAAPTLQVLPLEEQPVFQAFAQGRYFAQYQAALTGAGRNYASAADVLRYAVLYHDGGVYLDVDDRLLAAGEAFTLPNGARAGRPSPGLAATPLLAGPDDLLLYPTVAHEQLGLRVDYNNSLIGSQPGNPTLLAINERIRERFAEHPGFYDSRPPAGAAAAFNRYALQLSRISGPRLLNDVITERAPALRQLRALAHLGPCPTVNLDAVVDFPSWDSLNRRLLPFGEIAVPGHANSWAH